MILICLGLAYFLAEVFRKIGLPRVVGQIIAGLLLGIGALRTTIFGQNNMDVLTFLANLGIVLLFYYVGLEMNLKAFVKNIRKSALISVFNTTAPLILGFFLMRHFFHLDNIASLVVGIALSVSSQAVSVDILDELKLLKSRLGNIIVSAGAVDDVIELTLITILLSAFHISLSKISVFALLVDIALFLFIILILRALIVPSALKFFDREKSSTARFTGALIILLSIASLAELLQIGSFIGALVAGMVIRQTIFKTKSIPNWEEEDIANSLHIIAFGFLIPLFFVWIGINTDITLISRNIWLILLLTAIATVGTVGGTALAYRAGKGSLKEGWIIGWGMNPKGDVELVIAALALNAAIITSSTFTALVMMSLLTTIISPIVFERLISKHSKKEREKEDKHINMKRKPKKA